MTDELQGLIDRIRGEGTERAEREAAEILTRARARAEEIVRRAEAQARQIAEAAERDAAQTSARGRSALEQAARDVILAVGATLDRLLDRLVTRSAGAALGDDALGDVVAEILRAYARRGMPEGGLDVLLPEQEGARLRDAILAELGSVLGAGVEVRADAGVPSGFKIWIEGDRVMHDFSAESVGAAIAEFVRPALAAIVHGAARQLGAGEGGGGS